MSTEPVVQLRSGRELAVPETPERVSAVREWARRNAIEIVVVAGLAVVLGLVHAIGMNVFPARFDDEGAYVSQAWAVQTRFDLGHYTYWYDHPPLGWILIALYTFVTGAFGRAPYGVAGGRELMLLVHLLSVGLLYLVARRVGMRPVFAAMAVLLFGLSPLGIFYHRMVLLDNLAMPLLLGTFVLLLSPKRNLGAHAAGGLMFAVALLVKETFLLFLPAVAYVYWRRTEPRTRGYSVAVVLTTFLGTLLLYPLFALLRGELLPSEDRVSLVGAIMWQLLEREGSGSVFDPTTSAGQVMSGWLTLDTWLLVLGVGSAVAALFIRRLRWIGISVVTLGIMLLRPGYLPVMYVVAAIPFLALGVAGLFDESWARAVSRRGKSDRWSSVMRAGAVVAAAAVLVLGIWPGYRTGIAIAMNADADRPFREAQEWLADNLEDGDVVLLDSALWLDVVASGHPEDATIWYYKIDTDPGVTLPDPGDWRGVDYVVTTEVIRNTTYDLPNVENAIENSEPVVVFGDGEGRVEILRVVVP